MTCMLSIRNRIKDLERTVSEFVFSEPLEKVPNESGVVENGNDHLTLLRHFLIGPRPMLPIRLRIYETRTLLSPLISGTFCLKNADRHTSTCTHNKE